MTGADILVVGAGSAGCVLAARLSGAGFRTVLVEAGGEAEDPRIADPGAWPLLQGSAVDWVYRTIPQRGMAGRTEACPRGRVMGGSSAIHAMGHVRPHPDDIDAWAAAGATGWTWQALLPFFAMTETSPFAGEPGYGSDGPLSLVQPAEPHPLSHAHRQAGIEAGLTPTRDHNGARLAGPTLNTLTLRSGRRHSVSDAYLTPEVRARGTLRIETGITVDRLVFDGAAATGIEGRRGGSPVSLTARRIVLAAGSIGSPAILMRSGIGPATHLSRLGIEPRLDRPGVGRNLQDHLLAAGNVYRAKRCVPPSGTQHSESLTYIHADGDPGGAAPELVVGICSLPIVSEALPRPAAPLELGDGYTLMFGITHPRSRGTVRLASPNPDAAPMIDPAYLTAEEDREHFLQALCWARRIGAAAAYADWRAEEIYPRPADLESRERRLAFIEHAAITHHHPVGTCRMGTDEGAVVAPDLTVTGVPGLHVADGSVMPSLTTGPANATILAIAERAAGMLAERLT